MIRYQEVRAGNWVHCKYDSPISPDEDKQLDPLEVYSIWEQDKEKWECEWMYGIPLTSEWLKNFGFIEGSNDEYVIVDKDNCWFSVVNEGHYRFTVFYNSLTETFDDVDVHELQNLYLALTGEELQIKP